MRQAFVGVDMQGGYMSCMSLRRGAEAGLRRGSQAFSTPSSEAPVARVGCMGEDGRVR